MIEFYGHFGDINNGQMHLIVFKIILNIYWQLKLVQRLMLISGFNVLCSTQFAVVYQWIYHEKYQCSGNQYKFCYCVIIPDIRMYLHDPIVSHSFNNRNRNILW